MSIFKNIFKKQDDTVFYVNHYYNAEEHPYIEGFDARELYSTQANLHAVVSFLSDSIAQLPLNVYKREAEDIRKRDRDSVAAKLLYRPNADQTEYEFINGLVIEYFLFGESVIMILPDDSESGYQLRIIPSEWIIKRKYANNFAPSSLQIQATGNANAYEIPADNFVIFKMYSPGAPGSFQSPIASLKQTFSEQIQASRFRRDIWKSSGRLNSYITRPANITPWTKEARDAWIEAFRKGWSQGGQKSGSMPILEDGMEIKPYQFSAKEAQYAESVQLSREDVAAAYHVNPSLIWHTQTQTYASAKDNARALYADTLGPTLQMIQQRINAFLLPKIGADNDLYVEFNLEEKLKGSFEERASILQSAAGVPYLTVNEVRADLNRPPIEGGDERVIPMNVLIGGQASPQDSTADSYSNMYSSTTPETKTVQFKSRLTLDIAAKNEDVKRFQETLEKFFKRQEKSISTKLKAVENWWDGERWDKELTEDLYPILISVSEKLGRRIAKQLQADYYADNTEAYLQKLSETRAHYINENTYTDLLNAQISDKTTKEVFDTRLLAAATIATGLTDTANEFATREALEQAENQGAISKPTVTKTWITGENPRDEHAAMDGETVPYDEAFSNGLMWPHDYGPADETCGCNCSCSVTVEY